MSYLLVKALHVLTSTILFGTGIGSAYYLLRAVLDGDAVVVARVAAWVVLADWLFTATTVVLQPLTGLYLMHLAGFSLRLAWLLASLVLYAVALACWLPVVRLQIRMRDLARAAARDGAALPPAFHRCFALWFALGVPAFLAFVAIFCLMTVKPA